MKRRKILVLIPMLGLFLTGCSFQDVKSWVGTNMYSPVRDFFANLFGKKDNQEQPSDGGDPTPQPGPGPSEVAVEAVTVSPSSLALKTNSEDVQLTATVAPSNATNKEVEWSVEPAGVVSVSNGLVHVLAKGEAVVKAKSKADATKVGSCAVTVTEPDPGPGPGPTPGPTPVEGNVLYSIKNPGNQAGQKVSDYSAEEILGAFQTEASDKLITSVSAYTNAYFGGNGGDEQAGTNFELLDCLKVGKSRAQGTITLGLDQDYTFEKIKLGLLCNRDDGELTINGVTQPVTNKATKENLNPEYIEFAVASGAESLVFTNKNDATGNFAVWVTSIEFVNVSKSTPTPPVTPTVSEVKLDKYELAMTVGLVDQQLTATVVGENEPSQEVTWESDNEEVATVSATGLVHAVKQGTANITAKSVLDTTKVSKPCVVTVTESQVDIEVTGVTATGLAKTTYYVGDPLDLTGLVVTATFNVGDPQTIPAGSYTTNIDDGATLTKDDTSLVVTYQGVSATAIPLTINDAPAPVTQVSVYKFENEVSSTVAADTDAIEGWMKKQSGNAVIKGVSSFSKVYPGADGGSEESKWELPNSLKVGTSSAAGNIVFELENDAVVSSVTIKGFGWKNTLVVSAGNKESAAGAFTVISKDTASGDPSSVAFELKYLAVGYLEVSTSYTSAIITEIDLETTTKGVHKVAFKANGEGVENLPYDVALESGTVSMSDFREPSREGYDFKGWSLTSSGALVDSVTLSDADVEIYAIWEEKAGTNYVECDIEEGQLLITTTYGENKDTYYLPTDTTSSAPTAVKYSAVSAIDKAQLWTVTKSGDNWIITNSDGNYLTVVGNDNNRIRVTTLSSGKTGKWKMNSDGSLESVDFSSRFLGVYNAQDWRSYNSASHSNYQGSATALKFYKIAA